MKYTNLITNELDNISDQRWKIIAILVSKKPIAIASNVLDKTHPINAKDNPYKGMHAEIRCLRKAPPNKIKNSVMYVLRWSNGIFRLAKPCPMCMEHIEKADIKKVIYSTEKGMEEMKV